MSVPAEGGARESSPEVIERSAKSMCLRWLADRAFTRAELSSRLAAKGVPPEIAARVLDRFVEVGLVNDAEFAQEYVRSRHVFSGRGRQAIARELRAKGVEGHQAEAALSQVSAEDERERARALVRQRLDRVHREAASDHRRGGELDPRLESQRLVRKLAGMLERRGFASGVAFTVIREELASRGDDAADLPFS
jgi:regulatory protein